MRSYQSAISRSLVLAATTGLAVVLMLSALLMYQELNEMQGVYLRDMAARIAARLETLTPQELSDSLLETLSSEDPALMDIEIFRQPGNPALATIWSGRELFRTERLMAGGHKLFRTYIPFHSESQMRVARIDLSLDASDFLMVHAMRNLLVSSLTGLVLLGLVMWGIWSARRQMELEHLAHLGTMSAVLAHEIRNPLGTIKGFVQLAKEKAEQRVGSLLEPILTEVGRLEKLVSDLLMYAKPSAPAMRETNWADLARELEAYARQIIGGRPVMLRCDATPRVFRTDPDLLREVLWNLTRNAVESGASEIRLSATAHTIVVADNGPGLADSVKSKLFQPFVTTKAAGTGLGLSIAHKLVDALRGELVLAPVEPHGTRAEIMLHGTYSRHRR